MYAKLRSAFLSLLIVASLCGATGASAGGDSLFYGPNGEPLPFDSHEAVLDFLRDAQVLEAEEIGGSQNRPLKVLLEKDGVRAHAVFRGVNRSWQREWVRGKWYLHLLDRATSERAAYVVARMLGFDNIPPTVLREFDGRKGSLQLWLEGAEPHSKRLERRAEVPPGWTDQMTAIWVFDKLIYNVDRHPGNLLIDSSGTVWMIDHTQTFQYDEHLMDPDAVRSIPRIMWNRLRLITDTQFETALEGILSQAQIESFLERRRELIEHIDGLIAELGEDRVLRPHRGD